MLRADQPVCRLRRRRIPDYGVVCRGSYTHPRTGERFENVLGVRISWEKRWITLAPVATILGLAFKMYDPEHLLGDKEDIGITCALVPTEHEASKSAAATSRAAPPS